MKLTSVQRLKSSYFLKDLLRHSKNTIGQLITAGLNDLMPPHCLSCHKEILQPQSICEDCWPQLSFLTQPICHCCGYPFENNIGISNQSYCAACHAKRPHFHMARAAVTYNDLSRDLLLKFKHGDQQHIAPLFTRWLNMAALHFPEDIDVDYVIPIPLHRKRLIKRRFNQAALLAKRYAKQNDLIYIPNLLQRIKPTKPQGHLSLKARRRNLQGAFSVPQTFHKKLENRTILIIDDVYTTGSTVEEAAKILRKNGAKDVYILSVARVIRPQKVD
ncbi:ComF family protein [Curvivirga aplysinae]|uniref:ComF family protein n=1 Tax=Curvivirga aplysinae TaxID=2529852 RepID=UPI0012BBC635|nr:ComF family protein [Curvivirga aplysinae]MTI08661.1 ComF family protein [Curvivirga aplysinae]